MSGRRNHLRHDACTVRIARSDALGLPAGIEPDPNGMAVRLRDTWVAQPRFDRPSPACASAKPIEIGHVVAFVKDLAQTT